jgi:hypothetical protein
MAVLQIANALTERGSIPYSHKSPSSLKSRVVGNFPDLVLAKAGTLPGIPFLRPSLCHAPPFRGRSYFLLATFRPVLSSKQLIEGGAV